MADKEIKICVIVCASPDLSPEGLMALLPDNCYIMAADGGIKKLRDAGAAPDLFVGDFDSFDGTVDGSAEIVRLIPRKDDTDSMHCAELAVERSFKRVLILGGTGGRLDHTFSNYCVLRYLYENGIDALMLSDSEEVRYLGEGAHRFSDKQGCTFSLFPFGCESVTVSYVGDVDFPANHLRISSDSSIGQSNVFIGDNVTIMVENGGAILFNSLKKL